MIESGFIGHKSRKVLKSSSSRFHPKMNIRLHIEVVPYCFGFAHRRSHLPGGCILRESGLGGVPLQAPIAAVSPCTSVERRGGGRL